jgi:hypothetical protein
MKKLFKAPLQAKWTNQLLLPIFGLLFILLYFIAVFSHISTIKPFSTTDNGLNFVFMILGFVFCLLLFFDLLFRQNVSHIFLVVAIGFFVMVFALTKVINGFVVGTTVSRRGSVFYILALVGLGAMIYFYIVKGLDGDASFWYYAVLIYTIVFLLFASIASYSLFDAYGNKDNPAFWFGYMASRIMIYLLIVATAVSVQNDYDPNPIQLDEFGNPIDEKKDNAGK